jgi:hypothetical protein
MSATGSAAAVELAVMHNPCRMESVGPIPAFNGPDTFLTFKKGGLDYECTAV